MGEWVGGWVGGWVVFMCVCVWWVRRGRCSALQCRGGTLCYWTRWTLAPDCGGLISLFSFHHTHAMNVHA